MNPPNELNGVWQFLEDCGVLDHGTADEIEAARRLYWKEYFRQKKRSQRKSKPEINVSFLNHESLAKIKVQAKKHNRPLSVFIRESVLAYISQEYVNPNTEQWEQIQQSMYLTELQIKQIAEEDVDGMNFHRNYNLLLEKLMTLENEINNTLNQPQILEDSICSVLQRKPWYKTTLINLIEGL